MATSGTRSAGAPSRPSSAPYPERIHRLIRPVVSLKGGGPPPRISSSSTSESRRPRRSPLDALDTGGARVNSAGVRRTLPGRRRFTHSSKRRDRDTWRRTALVLCRHPKPGVAIMKWQPTELAPSVAARSYRAPAKGRPVRSGRRPGPQVRVRTFGMARLCGTAPVAPICHRPT